MGCKLAVGASVVELLEELPRLTPPDVVFNLFEGLGGVGNGEAEVTGIVELLGLPVTGSPAQCLSLVRDKARTKWLLAGAGLPTPEFVLVDERGPLDVGRLDALLARGPVIVKPAHEDASLGIGRDSIVTEFSALAMQIERVRSRYGPVLVERFIVGREFNAALVAFDEPELLPLAEIEFCGSGDRGWQIVTYEAKWDAGGPEDRATPPRCPAEVDRGTEDRIGGIARSAFRLTGCRDYARVDLRMDGQGQVYVLEINGNPDIGPSAGLARALRAGGWSYADFIERIVQTALSRSKSCAPEKTKSAH